MPQADVAFRLYLFLSYLLCNELSVHGKFFNYVYS